MRLNTPTRALTKTSIVYTDGHRDRHMDIWTNRVIPVYPPKTFLLQWYKYEMILCKNIYSTKYVTPCALDNLYSKHVDVNISHTHVNDIL